MKILALFLCFTLAACVPYKPELDKTQVVDGKSIIIPPDFDNLPKEK